MCSDYLNDYKELDGAGMYDHQLTAVMLDHLMEGNGDDENFKYPLRSVQMDLDRKLLSIRHMNYTDAHQAMVADELDVRSVLIKVKESYRAIKDKGKWKAASHAKDSKALNKNYGAVHMAASPPTDEQTKQLVHQLVRSALNRDKSKDKCNACGKVGHWANNCPDKKGRGKEKSGSRFAKKGRGGGQKKSIRTPWAPPPKERESEIKFIDGKKRYWCSKCNRWTESHGTDGHKSREELMKDRGQAKAGSARISFDLHPSAYKAIGPMYQDVKSEAKEVFQGFAPAQAAWGGALLFGLACMLLTGGSYTLLCTYGSGILSWISSNWVWCACTCSSGIIGFGTALAVAGPAEDDMPQPVRYRTGAAAQKQIWRTMKKLKVQPRVRKPKMYSFEPIPPHCIRMHQQPHHKYNRVGRNHKNYRGPSIQALTQRIVLLELQMRELRHRLDRQFGKPSPYNTNRCCMAALVDLNQVSSARSEREKEDETVGNVLFDSGANCCITPNKADFNGHFSPIRGNQVIDGIGKGLKICGKGHVTWTFKSDTGMYRTIKVPCYYVPSSNTRIASLQEVLKAYPDETITMNEKELRLSGSQGNPSITIPYCTSSNLPMGPIHQNQRAAYAGSTGSTLLTQRQSNVTIPSNVNLSEPEKEIINTIVPVMMLRLLVRATREKDKI